jgi:hypothetical protein
MAENTIAQFERLFQELDLQMSAANDAAYEAFVAFGEVNKLYKDLMRICGNYQRASYN